ncbi:MAG: extracellular solute-binding protein [Lachnospiraceae bacterium]|nr:extracellular solute-binding protein [Candidatus Merdinaster equi]
MNIGKRIGSIFLVLLVLAVFIYVAYEHDRAGSDEGVSAKDTIVLWYTDEVLADYLSSVALSYYEEYDVHVDIQLVSGLDYLETINRESLHGKDSPDIYIVPNTSLEKAYLAGLASVVSDPDGLITTDHYPQTAINAVTYDGKIVGYPMYFDTSVFVYNSTYMEQMARGIVEKEWEEQGLIQVFKDTIAASGASEEAGADADSSQDVQNSGSSDAAEAESEEGEEEINPLYEYPIFVKEVSEKAEALVPATVADILNFADQYDAPENVDAFFKWDVSDIFSNFFFIGNYVNLGGASGDDITKINLYNANAIMCMNIYQSLNQFFSIDAANSTYENVVNEFKEGKTMFTMATTDIIANLEAAKADGSFAYEYGIMTIPNLSENLDTRGFSITNTLVVNGYSSKKALANEFANFLCTNGADSLYSRTGKVSANVDVQYDMDALNTVLVQYGKSVPMPKAIELSNLWIELESAFTNIWKGADANTTLRRLSEKIKHQITGDGVIEEVIEVEQVDLLDPETVNVDESKLFYDEEGNYIGDQADDYVESDADGETLNGEGVAINEFPFEEDDFVDDIPEYLFPPNGPEGEEEE